MDAAPDVADPILVNDVLQQLKSEGTFDQFRRDCLGDVDTKPAYQNLRQRVESYVSNFLSGVTWSPTMNKNHLRDSLRRQINQSEILAVGVERVIEQVVDPQIQHAFRPKLEEVLRSILRVDLDPTPEMALPGSMPPTGLNPPQPFSGQVPADSNQSSFVSLTPAFTSVSTPPTMVSSSSCLAPPPLPYEAPPLPSSSPPPLPEEAPPPPLPEGLAPPPPPDEPPSASEPQDMDIDIEDTESILIDESIKSEHAQKTETFKFMKNLLHRAKDKIKSLIGEKEKPKIETEEMSVEAKVVKNVELMLDEKDAFDGKNMYDDDREEDGLTDITVSSVHTSDLSSFTEGISSSSSSSELSDSDEDEKMDDDAEIPGERSLSRSSSMATDSDRGSSKGSGKKSSNLALAISRYHSDSDEDMEKRQERRRKAAVAREERASLRQQAREEHQKKIEQMKAERLVKKRRKALQEKSSTSDEEEADDRAGRREKRTRSIQLKEQMKEKLLEKKKEKKRMAYASLSDETFSSPRKNVKSKQIEIYRFDLIARKLKKPVVKYHHLLCEELTGEEQTIASKKNFRGPEFKKKMLAKKEKLEKAKRKLELSKASDLPKTSSDDNTVDDDNDEMGAEINVGLIVDSKDINKQLEISADVQTNIDTSGHHRTEIVEEICDVAVTSSRLEDGGDLTENGSDLIADSQRKDDVVVTDKNMQISGGLTVKETLKDEAQTTDVVAMTEVRLEDESQISSDLTHTESTVETESEKKDVVTDRVEDGTMEVECQMNVDILTENKKAYKSDDVVIADCSMEDEPQKSLAATDNLKDETERSGDVEYSGSRTDEESQKICDVTDSTLAAEKQIGEDIAATDNIRLEDGTQKSEDVAVTGSLEVESQKTDELTVTDSLKDETQIIDDPVVADRKLEGEPQISDDKKAVEEDETDLQKQENIAKESLGIAEDNESVVSSNIEVQESDISENPPTPTQDEPSSLEEIAEVEPAAIPIYSLSPAAYQGPQIGSLFKVGKDDAERSTGQEESSAGSPLSAISSGDLSGGEEEEKTLEDEEPDEEGEIKEEAESVTEEKPSEELKTEGRYGMRCRRKIHSPRYSDDEYLLYGFKKTRSSGSTEDKAGKEAKAGSKTKTTETERVTRKSSRTDNSAAKEEGEVDEQPDPKKRRKVSTEDNSSIMSGRRQRQVPRRYSPSESVTGRRAPSPTPRAASRYTEQPAFGERRTRRQSSPAPPQRETGRNRRGATPPRRGLRRPSGDRTSENYQPVKRKR